MVLQLRDQLNFYFGDSNLRQDKFLREKLKESSQVPLSLFLGFNRIKSIVGGGSGSEAEAEKISLLQQAVTKSNILKLSKCGNLMKRRLPFDLARVNSDRMDASTVYVENFPSQLTHSEIAKIFNRAGEIRNVRVPKFSGNIISKGFCFVEFDCEEAANKACELFNNCVPEEFTNSECKNYINVQSSLKQLNVITKREWSTSKE